MQVLAQTAMPWLTRPRNVYIYIHVYVYIPTHTHIYSVYIYIHVYTYKCIYTCEHAFMTTYICIMCLCARVCWCEMYIHNIYIYMYGCVYIRKQKISMNPCTMRK